MAKERKGSGAISANFHEGSRSEYLAQYVFSMFGASIPIPRQEDYGVDLHCTLFSDRDGQVVWPVAYFSVQIKSESEPWEFPTPKSVKWLVEYPAPLLLCFIRKTDGRVRVYQTMARFHAAVAQELPERLSLIPGEPGPEVEGNIGKPGPAPTYSFDAATGGHSLGPPILEFNVQDLLDDEQFSECRAVLNFWVRLDFENVRRYQMGMRSVLIPGQHTTNKVPTRGNARHLLQYATPEIRTAAEQTAYELIEWLIAPRLNDKDYLGALLALLMLRQRNQDPFSPSSGLVLALRDRTRLDSATGTKAADYVFASIDKLLAELAEKVRSNEPGPDVAGGN